MSIKNTLLAGLAAIAVSAPLYAHASDLTLKNDTDFNLTTIINDTACSTILGKYGVTPPHQSNTVPEYKVIFACLANQSNCKADVYMTDHCNSNGEKPVATVYFDTSKGLKTDKTVIYDSSYTIFGSGFNLGISGGHALLSKK